MSKYVAKEFAGSVTLLFQVAGDCFCVDWGKNGKYLNWVQIGFEMDYNGKASHALKSAED